MSPMSLLRKPPGALLRLFSTTRRMASATPMEDTIREKVLLRQLATE